MGRRVNQCCCKDGSVKDRWLNITKVRPNNDGGTPGAPHYTCDPYERFIEGIKEAPSHEDDLSWCEDQTGCAGCGSWLAGADMNGYSAQDTDLVDKIMECGSADATHQSLDHNCYEKSGTVDMKGERRGGRWVLGKKFWHGIFGYYHRIDPNVFESIAFDDGAIADGATGFGAVTYTFQETPPQLKYLTATYHTEGHLHRDLSGISDYYFEADGSATIGRTTGLESKTGSASVDAGFGGYNFDDIIGEQFTLLNKSVNEWAQYFAAFITPSYPAETAYFVQSGTNTYQLWSGLDPDYLIEEVSVSLGGGHRKMWNSDGVLTREESVSVTNSGVTYNFYKHDIGDTIEIADDELEIASTAVLTDEYTAADCLQDFYAALQSWNLAAANYHYISAGRNWRRDEAMALAPLVLFDEIPAAQSPSPSYGTIDLYDTGHNSYSVGSPDYEQDQDADDAYGRSFGDPEYIPTWHKRAYIDPAGQMWAKPSGERYIHSDSSGTAFSTLLGPMRTGEIIAAGIEGGERLFWFKAENYERVQDTDLGDPSWHWNQISEGALSDTRLPEATRRWMNLDESQWDGEAYRGVSVPPPSGNYPQSFLRQQNGVLVGAKYVEATQTWPAVNFDYPCGDGRYDVDQTTVCCLVSGDAGSGFRVKKTGDASSVPANGSKILVEGDGIYTVTGVTSHGGTPAEWTLAVSAKIEDVPAGRSCWPKGMDTLGLYSDGATHIGQLRWYSETETPCVTNDVSHRTGVRRAYTFNARAARLDTADQPLWLGGTTAGDGEGIVGVTGLSMAEFSYEAGRCPAVVGYAPFYEVEDAAASPVEDFGNQVLFAMPDTFTFDDLYGALWLGMVDMVMEDPFWQTPFKPDCAIDPETETLNWTEDNGIGAEDSLEVDGGMTAYTSYYPHRRWVAACCTIPSGKSLPSGIELFYATGSAISPVDGVNVHYDTVSGGIVIGDDAGNYRSIERPWGFTDRACTVDNRFGDFYETFTNCP